MKIHVKNLKSRIETDNPKLLKALVDFYTFSTPGYEFSKSYRRRQWDGKTRFISKAGYFRTGLLSDILNTLKKIECDPEIIYHESESLDLNDKNIKGFNYYDYQESLIDRALEAKRCIVKSPTGSGKTLIMAGIVKALQGQKMVILFNAKQLLRQTYEFFTDACGFSNVGLSFGDGYIHGNIMLCTIQSIETILDTHLTDAGVLMVDECHEFANGKITLPAIQSFPNAFYRFGFTATIPSDPIPLNNLKGAFGDIVEQKTTAELVEEGTLTKPIIQLIDRPYTANGIDESMSYMDVYDNFIVNNTDRNSMIKTVVTSIRNSNKNAKILVLTKSLEHGRILKDLIGGDCEFLEGANSLAERYQAIDRFRQNEGNSVLIGTKILQTGVNIQEITHFINARGMKSEIATLQALGRSLRKHESKSKVFVYDFLDKEKYLSNHSKAREKHYRKEGHEVEVI